MGERNEREMISQIGRNRRYIELKDFIREASRALAKLDADRLSELRSLFQELSRVAAEVDVKGQARLTLQVRDASKEMKVFARVIEATRDNLQVLYRLRDSRDGNLEYSAFLRGAGVFRGSSNGTD
jgi:hypothetical protein